MSELQDIYGADCEDDILARVDSLQESAERLIETLSRFFVMMVEYRGFFVANEDPWEASEGEVFTPAEWAEMGEVFVDFPESDRIEMWGRTLPAKNVDLLTVGLAWLLANATDVANNHEWFCGKIDDPLTLQNVGGCLGTSFVDALLNLVENISHEAARVILRNTPDDEIEPGWDGGIHPFTASNWYPTTGYLCDTFLGDGLLEVESNLLARLACDLEDVRAGVRMLRQAGHQDKVQDNRKNSRRKSLPEDPHVIGAANHFKSLKHTGIARVNAIRAYLQKEGVFFKSTEDRRREVDRIETQLKRYRKGLGLD